jgi:hypothetical protein
MNLHYPVHIHSLSLLLNDAVTCQDLVMQKIDEWALTAGSSSSSSNFNKLYYWGFVLICYFGLLHKNELITSVFLSYVFYSYILKMYI